MHVEPIAGLVRVVAHDEQFRIGGTGKAADCGVRQEWI